MNERERSFDFDRRVDRRGTDSVKWDLKTHTHDGRDILPMWVADMDFAIPEVVLSALSQRISHPVFGYGYISDVDREAFTGWQLRRNRWEIDPGWLIPAPGVMPAVRAAVLSFTKPGDEVVVQSPVYYPFFEAIRENGRTVVDNPLVEVDHRYEMDLEHLASRITNRTRLLVLCSPHNPVGRVWTVDELTALGEICERHDIMIVCDEIHSDLIRDGFTFTSLASLSPEISKRTVTCVSPTKTFNIAGIASGFAIVEDPHRREVLQSTMTRLGMDLPNVLSLSAATAAYTSGDQWLDQLLVYLNGTYSWFEREIENRFPDIGLTPIQGTYLAWLDFRKVMKAAGADDKMVHRTLLGVGGLWLSNGHLFGPGGQGFQRMNLACPRETVRDGLNRMERALEALS
jgi:cysteine-S-conjugate beta-lyase